MIDALANFKQKSQSDISDNPKAPNVPIDAPPNEEQLPGWIKCVIGVNLIMIHLVIMLNGFDFIPFRLDEWPLAVYVITGLGLPIGLAKNTIKTALAGLFGIKST